MEIFLGVVSIVVGYFLGSIPVGLLLAKHKGLGDIRKKGSGNIGATNVLRTGDKKLAALTLVLDMLKGFVAVVVAELISSKWGVSLAALAAVVGHIFPVWLNFKGGKGVATTIAVYFAIFTPSGIFASLIWLSMFFLSRMSSLASIVSVFMTFLFTYFFTSADVSFMSFAITILVIYRHKDNIHRIMRGEESKFQSSK